MESGGVRNHQQRGSGNFPLQWGNRKRLRCAKMQVKDYGKEKITVRVDRRVVRADKESNLLRRPSLHCVLRNSEAAGGTMKGQINGGAEAKDSDEAGQDKKLSSPGTDATVVLPKFTMGLTNKEKEEDFMAIKGSRLPQRPKKRAKFIQRTLNLVSPGLWLCDLTIERYEVREKKITKKRPRGLKAMGNMESGDSE